MIPYQHELEINYKTKPRMILYTGTNRMEVYSFFKECYEELKKLDKYCSKYTMDFYCENPNNIALHRKGYWEAHITPMQILLFDPYANEQFYIYESMHEAVQTYTHDPGRRDYLTNIKELETKKLEIKKLEEEVSAMKEKVERNNKKIERKKQEIEKEAEHLTKKIAALESIKKKMEATGMRVAPEYDVDNLK